MLHLKLLFSKFYHAKIIKLKADRFWAFSKEWNHEIDKAIAAKNGDRLAQLYKAIKAASDRYPDEFPLRFLIPVPREIEDQFAKAVNNSDHVVLHNSLQRMSNANQEKLVKKIIKFWLDRDSAAVPQNLVEWISPTVSPIAPKSAPTPRYAIVDPVVSTPIFDKDALNILLGNDRQKNPLYWSPSHETNGFALVIGASGSGKTESLKAIAHETDAYGIPILVVDFHADIILDCCKTIPLSHTSACEYGINPLELDSLDPINGGVFPQVQKLIESIAAFNPSMGYRQKLCIEKYISECYGNFGIRDANPESWQKTPPTFLDVINLMERDADLNKDVASALAVVSSVFKHPVFSKPMRLDIESLISKSHRIDLSALNTDIQFLVVDTLLRKIGCALSAKGHIPVKCGDLERYRFGVFMDEAHKFTSKATSRKGIIDVFACELRKYGLMMVLGSQNLDHFSPDTISQVATKILLKLQSAESARFPANEFGLTVDAITKHLQGRGHGYLKRGSAEAIEFQFTPMHNRSSTNRQSNRQEGARLT